jgi:hypothetical protein
MPASAIEEQQAGSGSFPDSAVEVAGKSREFESRLREEYESPIFEKAHSRWIEGNPKSTIGRRHQRVDVTRGKPNSGRRVELLEPHPIELKEAPLRTDPQVPIGGLGERGDLAGSAIVRRPSCVVKLRDGAISIQAE